MFMWERISLWASSLIFEHVDDVIKSFSMHHGKRNDLEIIRKVMIFFHFIESHFELIVMFEYNIRYTSDTNLTIIGCYLYKWFSRYQKRLILSEIYFPNTHWISLILIVFYLENVGKFPRNVLVESNLKSVGGFLLLIIFLSSHDIGVNIESYEGHVPSVFLSFIDNICHQKKYKSSVHNSICRVGVFIFYWQYLSSNRKEPSTL
jgi:hypothetical protein